MTNQNKLKKSILSQIPTGVWALGMVSLLMDISSEMIHSLLPLFMVTSLGLSSINIGLIEGLAEATALIVKVFSGVISDYLGKRKALALLGYGLGAFTKPLFAIATSSGMILSARLIDRVGKGIRGAPRDALIAEITPLDIRGAAFGLRQALDTVGAFLGPLLAVFLMYIWQDDFRSVFWVAVIPGIMAVFVLLFGIKEPEKPRMQIRTNPVSRESLRKLDTAYWQVVLIGGIFTMARFSEAFLIMRAQQTEIQISLIPLLMVAMNIIYSISAYPFGKLSDAISHVKLLNLGLWLLIIADLVLANAESWEMVLCGVMIWGLHMGMTQGLLTKMVADNAPKNLLGTAYGFFNLVCGIAMLLASLLAGWVWDYFGAAYTFYTAAGICVITLMLQFKLKFA